MENHASQTTPSSSARSSVRVALVASRQYAKLTEQLVRRAVEVLMNAHIAESDMRIMWAPRNFQMPLLVQSMARSKEFDGILVLGIAVKDMTDTYYFENAEVARGLMDVMMQTSVPINTCIIAVEQLRDAKKLVTLKDSKNPATVATQELIDLLTV